MLRYGWSTKKTHWDAIGSQVREANWRKVSFTYDSREFIPESRGIYIVELSAKNIITTMPMCSFSSPIYIGHSTKLKQRFKQHTIGNRESNLRHKMSGFMNCVYFHFAVFDNYPKDELKVFEQILIEVFGPPLNTINSVSPGVITEIPIQAHYETGEL